MTGSVVGVFEPDGPWDRRLARSATGVLAELNRAGILTPADVHVARRLTELAAPSEAATAAAGATGAGPAGPDEGAAVEGADSGGSSERESVWDAGVAVALAVQAVRRGSVCLDLTRVRELSPDREWPDPIAWAERLAASPELKTGAVHLAEGRLYLDRYLRLEEQVFHDLEARRMAPPPPLAEPEFEEALARVFPTDGYAEQLAAARSAGRLWTTVITGGPGTGKTTTVAGLLAALLAEAEARGERPRIALAAPTGKAASRLQESVSAEAAKFPQIDRDRLSRVGAEALTLHRLLGFRPDNATRFRHHRGHRLRHDLVIVDEASMVGLELMARLLEALTPQTRLVLVGDADQLASVSAGAVLADVVSGYQALGAAAVTAEAPGGPEAPYSPVFELTTTHRYGAGIGRLAGALRRGDADEVMAVLRSGDPTVEFVEPTQTPGAPDSVATAIAVLRPTLLAHAGRLREAALDGAADQALELLGRHRLICAHRDGPWGVSYWNRLVESWLAEAEGALRWPRWYAGRPLLVTGNDYALGIYNGESGVTVTGADGRLRGVIAGAGGNLEFAPTRLGGVETMHALTVHKSQGSQAGRVSVLLPPVESRLLSRELFYTAVTRAREQVQVIGSEAEVRAAVARTAQRATGLAERLAQGVGSD